MFACGGPFRLPGFHADFLRFAVGEGELDLTISKKYGKDLLAAKHTVKKQERHEAVRAVKDKIKAEFLAIDAKTLKPVNDPFHVAMAVSMVEALSVVGLGVYIVLYAVPFGTGDGVA